MEHRRHELRDRFVSKRLLLLRCGRSTNQHRCDKPQTGLAHEFHPGRMIPAASRATPGVRLASPLTIHRAIVVFFQLFGRRTLHGGTTATA
jgi:hypothetical protein